MTWFSLNDGAGTRLGFACTLALFACSDDGLTPSNDDGAGVGVTTASLDGGDVQTAGGDGEGTSDGSPGTGGSGHPGSDDSGTSGGPVAPECQSDDDCIVVEDCCTCGAAVVGAQPPACRVAECTASACDEQGLDAPKAVCRNDMCQLERVGCDASTVTCDEDPPTCEAPMVPRVVGNCWEGCVLAEHCDFVPECSYCVGQSVCVPHRDGERTRYACEPLPATCDDSASCACLPDLCDEPLSCAASDDMIACEA